MPDFDMLKHEKRAEIDSLISTERVAFNTNKVTEKYDKDSYSNESTKRTIAFIDHVLDNYATTEELHITAKEKARLKNIRTRGISHLLLNKRSFFGWWEPSELKQVKKTVGILENLLAESRDRFLDSGLYGVLMDNYRRAISSCSDYLNDPKKKRNSKWRAVNATMRALSEEMNEYTKLSAQVENGELDNKTVGELLGFNKLTFFEEEQQNFVDERAKEQERRALVDQQAQAQERQDLLDEHAKAHEEQALVNQNVQAQDENKVKEQHLGNKQKIKEVVPLQTGKMDSPDSVQIIENDDHVWNTDIKGHDKLNELAHTVQNSGIDISGFLIALRKGFSNNSVLKIEIDDRKHRQIKSLHLTNIINIYVNFWEFCNQWEEICQKRGFHANKLKSVQALKAQIQHEWAFIVEFARLSSSQPEMDDDINFSDYTSGINEYIKACALDKNEILKLGWNGDGSLDNPQPDMKKVNHKWLNSKGIYHVVQKKYVTRVINNSAKELPSTKEQAKEQIKNIINIYKDFIDENMDHARGEKGNQDEFWKCIRECVREYDMYEKVLETDISDEKYQLLWNKHATIDDLVTEITQSSFKTDEQFAQMESDKETPLKFKPLYSCMGLKKLRVCLELASLAGFKDYYEDFEALRNVGSKPIPSSREIINENVVEMVFHFNSIMEKAKTFLGGINTESKEGKIAAEDMSDLIEQLEFDKNNLINSVYFLNQIRDQLPNELSYNKDEFWRIYYFDIADYLSRNGYRMPGWRNTDVSYRDLAVCEMKKIAGDKTDKPWKEQYKVFDNVNYKIENHTKLADLMHKCTYHGLVFETDIAEKLDQTLNAKIPETSEKIQERADEIVGYYNSVMDTCNSYADKFEGQETDDQHKKFLELLDELRRHAQMEALMVKDIAEDVEKDPSRLKDIKGISFSNYHETIGLNSNTVDWQGKTWTNEEYQAEWDKRMEKNKVSNVIKVDPVPIVKNKKGVWNTDIKGHDRLNELAHAVMDEKIDISGYLVKIRKSMSAEFAINGEATMEERLEKTSSDISKIADSYRLLDYFCSNYEKTNENQQNMADKLKVVKELKAQVEHEWNYLIEFNKSLNINNLRPTFSIEDYTTGISNHIKKTGNITDILKKGWNGNNSLEVQTESKVEFDNKHGGLVELNKRNPIFDLNSGSIVNLTTKDLPENKEKAERYIEQIIGSYYTILMTAESRVRSFPESDEAEGIKKLGMQAARELAVYQKAMNNGIPDDLYQEMWNNHATLDELIFRITGDTFMTSQQLEEMENELNASAQNIKVLKSISGHTQFTSYLEIAALAGLKGYENDYDAIRNAMEEQIPTSAEDFKAKIIDIVSHYNSIMENAQLKLEATDKESVEGRNTASDMEGLIERINIEKDTIINAANLFNINNKLFEKDIDIDDDSKFKFTFNQLPRELKVKGFYIDEWEPSEWDTQEFDKQKSWKLFGADLQLKPYRVEQEKPEPYASFKVEGHGALESLLRDCSHYGFIFEDNLDKKLNKRLTQSLPHTANGIAKKGGELVEIYNTLISDCRKYLDRNKEAELDNQHQKLCASLDELERRARMEVLMIQDTVEYFNKHPEVAKELRKDSTFNNNYHTIDKEDDIVFWTDTTWSEEDFKEAAVVKQRVLAKEEEIAAQEEAERKLQQLIEARKNWDPVKIKGHDKLAKLIDEIFRLGESNYPTDVGALENISNAIIPDTPEEIRLYAEAAIFRCNQIIIDNKNELLELEQFKKLGENQSRLHDALERVIKRLRMESVMFNETADYFEKYPEKIVEIKKNGNKPTFASCYRSLEENHRVTGWNDETWSDEELQLAEKIRDESEADRELSMQHIVMAPVNVYKKDNGLWNIDISGHKILNEAAHKVMEAKIDISGYMMNIRKKLSMPFEYDNLKKDKFKAEMGEIVDSYNQLRLFCIFYLNLYGSQPNLAEALQSIRELKHQAEYEMNYTKDLLLYFIIEDMTISGSADGNCDYNYGIELARSEQSFNKNLRARFQQCWNDDGLDSFEEFGEMHHSVLERLASSIGTVCPAMNCNWDLRADKGQTDDYMKQIVEGYKDSIAKNSGRLKKEKNPEKRENIEKYVNELKRELDIFEEAMKIKVPEEKYQELWEKHTLIDEYVEIITGKKFNTEI